MPISPILINYNSLYDEEQRAVSAGLGAFRGALRSLGIAGAGDQRYQRLLEAAALYVYESRSGIIEETPYKKSRETKKYNHAFDIAFEVYSDNEGEAVTADELFAGLRARIASLEHSQDPAEILEACGAPHDTFVQNEEDGGAVEVLKEYCPEHGLVEAVDDGDVLRCQTCERATSTTPEEAERFENQDKEEADGAEDQKTD